MEIQFLPLDLWRASSLAQETKTVVAAFERCLASGDVAGLEALRRAIEKRIDDLEAFYIANVEDERSVLFERQRTKLRRLLSDYDSAIPGAKAPAAASSTDYYGSGGAAGGASAACGGSPSYGGGYDGGAGAAAGGAGGGATVITREIREDTRLTLAELLAWFTQAGVAEMPEVSPDAVQRVFNNLTRTNLDGKMSVRDLRQWYITFGKRAIREGLPLDGKEIVSLALVKAVAATAVTARKEEGAAMISKKSPLEALAAAAAAPLAASSAAVAASISPGVAAAAAAAGGVVGPKKQLYTWEAGATSAAGGGPAAVGGFSATASSARTAAGAAAGPFLDGSLTAGPAAPIVLPNGMLEFQVRLTPEEYALVQRRKRQLEAEAAHRARLTAAKEKAAHLKGAPLPGYVGPAALAAAAAAAQAAAEAAAGREISVPLHYGATSLITTGPYEEPAGANAFFYRSP